MVRVRVRVRIRVRVKVMVPWSELTSSQTRSWLKLMHWMSAGSAPRLPRERVGPRVSREEQCVCQRRAACIC